MGEVNHIDRWGRKGFSRIVVPKSDFGALEWSDDKAMISTMGGAGLKTRSSGGAQKTRSSMDNRACLKFR